MKVSVGFHTYVAANGPQHQKCYHCGAVHNVAWNGTARMHDITLHTAGQQMAAMTEPFPYPEYKPHRVGAYRVQYSNHNWSPALWNWDGDKFHNGPVLAREGSIVAWVGLAGDMEHLKARPEDLSDPLPGTAAVDEGDEL